MHRLKYGPKKHQSTQTRSKYEDHSLRFVEWVNELGFEKTFIGRFLSGLETRFRIKRLSLLFIFSLVLALLITYEIEVPYNFEAGQVAKVNFNSPLSFEMTDEVTTEEKRLKADTA